MYKHFFKRLIDFVLVLCVLFVIWPILLIITVWLHFSNKGTGVFFVQERVGKNGKKFKIFKFKSMTDEKDLNGNLLPDFQRITKIGRFVRSTSIDELPQLFNVLKGDMSLVGPRPLLSRYLPYYTEEENHRHDVRPGITGYAQCHGRNNVTWDDKLLMDIYYVNNLSFKLDCYIIFKTMMRVIKRVDVCVVNKEIAFDIYRKKQLDSE